MKKMELSYDDLIVKGAKLNFQVFNTLEINGKNLEYLHLVSSAIMSGSLRNVRFYNASFLSTKFSKVIFEKCNLKSTDICSIWATNCQFQNTDFSNATISDSTFIKCTFDAAIFKSISMTKCQFIDCTFEQFLIDDSTFSLNTFTRCKITHTHFTESFYYQIFDDCTFQKVNMSPILLGFNFGFSSNVFAQLSDEDNLKETHANFINKGLYINAAILRINQIQNYYDEAMIACVASLGQMIQNDILVKADEIEFIRNLTSYFQERKQIAPISILRIWQILTSYSMIEDSNIAASKAMTYIREYANMLYFSFMDFEKELQRNLEQLSNDSKITDTAELKIIYSEKPVLKLLDFLTEFSILADKNCPMPSLIRTEKGSFREFHDIAVIVIPYLQTFFALLGVVVPIAIYKKQKSDHKQEEQLKKDETATKEKKEIEVTLTTSGNNPSSILLPNAISVAPSTNAMIADTIKILGTQPVINSVGFAGYNAQNIQSITIRFQ